MRESQFSAGPTPPARLLARDQDALDAETRLLVEQYGGDGRPEDLLAMARLFDAAATQFPVGEARLRLWAGALRRQAVERPQPAGW